MRGICLYYIPLLFCGFELSKLVTFIIWGLNITPISLIGIRPAWVWLSMYAQFGGRLKAITLKLWLEEAGGDFMPLMTCDTNL